MVQPLGKEHNDHEEEEKHNGGHAHHHTHHLKLCDRPVTTRTLVPDVVLRVTPTYKKETQTHVTLALRGLKMFLRHLGAFPGQLNVFNLFLSWLYCRLTLIQFLYQPPDIFNHLHRVSAQTINVSEELMT